MKLVIVEDSHDLLEAWSEILEIEGHDVVGHTTGHALLADRAAIGRADALISDYYLPDLNGIELLKQVRSIHASLPMVLLTGSRDAAIKSRVAAIPGAHVIYKPIEPDVLEQFLRGICSGSPASQPRATE